MEKMEQNNKLLRDCGKENAQRWSSLHFPYMYIQSDFSVYTMKSWNPGFKIEISCNESQGSSNPWWTCCLMASFKCVPFFFFLNFDYCCSQKLGLFHYYFGNCNNLFLNAYNKPVSLTCISYYTWRKIYWYSYILHLRIWGTFLLLGKDELCCDWFRTL